MKLLNLPNELIVFIFVRVQVTDLVLHLPLTSSQLTNLSEIACNRRTSLVLVFGNKNKLGFPFVREQIPSIKGSFVNPQSSTDTLVYKKIYTLSSDFLDKIVTKFPNVKALQLSADGITASQVKQAVTDKLLLCLLPNLEALHLVLSFAKIDELDYKTIDSEESIIEALHHSFHIINQMSKLRRLVFSTWEEFDPIDLSILGQLREFYYFTLDDTDTIYASIVKYGVPNRELKRIGFKTDTNIDDLLTTNILLYNQPNNFSSKITHLDLFDFTDSLSREKELLLRLPSLLSMNIQWDRSRPLAPLIEMLAKFKLEFLVIYIKDSIDPQMTDLSSLASHCRLNSVKALKIKYYETPSHEEWIQFHLDKIFPKLKSILIETNFVFCFDCLYSHQHYLTEDEGYVSKRAKCMKLAVQSLQQMESKPKIMVHYFSHPRRRYLTVKL